MTGTDGRNWSRSDGNRRGICFMSIGEGVEGCVGLGVGGGGCVGLGLGCEGVG